MKVFAEQLQSMWLGLGTQSPGLVHALITYTDRTNYNKTGFEPSHKVENTLKLLSHCQQQIQNDICKRV